MIMQNKENIKKWAKYLETTGGKLSSAKSKSCIIKWEWNKNKLELSNEPTQYPWYHSISNIPIVHPTTTIKYLGIQISLGNNQQKHL